MAATGCEVNTHTDIANCGGCGMACVVPANVASVVCGNAVCGIGSCSLGFADCDKMAGNGCEVSLLNDVKNCGGCSAACMLANAAPGCAAGKCTVGMCNMGYADCDKTAGNGCEINTLTDVKNCGGCGKACALANAVSACVVGACAVQSCNAGFADCDKNPANGCEVSTNTE